MSLPDDLSNNSPIALLGQRLLDGDDRLTELLVEGRSIPITTLDADLVDALTSHRLARCEGEQVVPLSQIDVWQDLLVAHDLDELADIGPDTVLGVNNTTRALAALTPSTQVRRSLDIATGPGGLALLLARHSNDVVATDLSEQACTYARLSAALNNSTHDVRTGDLYEPVAGDPSFDIVTGNLPFVVSPDTAYTFRDGGRSRDLMSKDAVTGAAQHLAPGGTALLMCNWIVPRDSEAGEQALEWVTSPDCTVVALHHSTETPRDYAARWNSFLLKQDPAAYATTIDRWVSAFESWDIDGIANGTIIVHKPIDGTTFRRSFQMRSAPSGEGGAQVERILTNGAWLERSNDEELLTARPALVSPHRLQQAMHYDGSWTAEQGSMMLTNSAGVVGEVHPLATHVVLRLDGATTVGELVDDVVDDTGIELAPLTEATVTTMRGLIAAGCVLLDDKPHG